MPLECKLRVWITVIFDCGQRQRFNGFGGFLFHLGELRFREIGRSGVCKEEKEDIIIQFVIDFLF
jgi:hypothetical protein